MPLKSCLTTEGSYFKYFYKKKKKHRIQHHLIFIHQSVRNVILSIENKILFLRNAVFFSLLDHFQLPQVV